jgi:hypothetical protein
MLVPCSRARAVFIPAGIYLHHPAPVSMLWDEHGGTFILRVSELKVLKDAGAAAESGIWLDLAFTGPQALLQEITLFARHHRLDLAPMSPPPAELTETPMLAAFHVPGPNLFVYCEDPSLRVRPSGPQTLELAVTGEFRVRQVPCREADVVIHLTAAAMSRLLGGLLAWAREGQ